MGSWWLVRTLIFNVVSHSKALEYSFGMFAPLERCWALYGPAKPLKRALIYLFRLEGVF